MAGNLISSALKIVIISYYWRMGWDSNPRCPCGHAGFQDRCLKPLGHPSQRLKSCVFAGADTCHRFDLDLERRVGKRRHLYQGRGREIAGEEFASRLPYFLTLRDVGDKDGDFEDVRHAAAGGFDEMPDLREDRFGLSVFVAFRSAGGHAGQISDAVDDEAVRPGAGGGLRHLRARDTDDFAHRLSSYRSCRIRSASRSSFGSTSSALAGGTGKLARTTPRSR